MDNWKIPMLQKCPFCGGDVGTIVNQYELNDYQENDDAVKMFTVVCDYDKGGCGATCGFHSSEYYAALAWNTRW